ncbi:MAG TPA: 3-oxoacyl-[acyl-carrier-protein] synthase III C-terminal domain-containing protein [Actinospica sp.]|nr:3-oxoacyl-[acyl-carrier-protein] synthase III C-terminal domain-containing protein [Actinospica sp.]
MLGEVASHHAEIPDLEARAADLGVPYVPDVWGWGYVHQSRRSLEELAIEAGTATLRAAGVDPSSVDALVLCCTAFPGGADDHGDFVRTIAEGLGTGETDFLGVTLDRCTNLLAGLRVAEAFVASGIHRRVLVITTDRVTDEAERLGKFALFSDGAAAALVSDDDGEYELVASAAAHEMRELDWSNQISPDLSRRVNTQLMKRASLEIDQVDILMHTNIFEAIITMKELQAGFSAAQLYTDNIARTGHCFAADPIINLTDLAAAGRLRENGHFLLAASVPGVRYGILLRKRAH